MTDNEVSWELAKKAMPIDSVVSGIVTRHALFGIFVKFENVPYDGFVEAIAMRRDGYDVPGEYPPIGSGVLGTVVGYRDWSKQIEMTLKPKTCRSCSLCVT